MTRKAQASKPPRLKAAARRAPSATLRHPAAATTRAAATAAPMPVRSRATEPRTEVKARAPRKPTVSRGGSEDMVRLYLRDIGRIPMLTDAQFDALAVRIDRLREADDDEALQAAYQELVTANLRLVVSIAKRYTNCGIPLMDLIQVGNMGLMRAAQGFDFSRGCRLSTYASKWIHATITRYISNQARTIRVPVNVIPMMSRLDRAERELTLRTGRTPTIEDLTEATGFTGDQVRRLLDVPQQSRSLDFPIHSADSEVTLGEVVEDPNAVDSREAVEAELFLEHLTAALDEALDEREQEVLRLRYGLGGGDALTQSEIGERLNVSRQRVSQIESRALRRLRVHASGTQLKSYVN